MNTTPTHTEGSQIATLHTLNGTDSLESYVALATRDAIFLGIKFAGLADGARLGAPGKTYFHARLRSARDLQLTAKINSADITSNVVSLAKGQLSRADAWPSLAFDRIDSVRASVSVGAFIQGSLLHSTAEVLTNIEKGEIFAKLASYAAKQVGEGEMIASISVVANWLRRQAAPLLTAIKQSLLLEQQVVAAKAEFATTIESQIEVFGPQMQLLEAIIVQHVQALSQPAGPP